MLLGWVLFRRRVTRGQLAAFAVSYLGILVVFGAELRLEGADVLLGSALVLGSALSYAVYLVYSGQEVQRLGSLRLTGLATSVACLLCIVQYLVLRPVGTALALPAAVWWLSVLNAVACTFAPVLMVMMAIERVGASVTAQAGLVGPVFTILLGVLLLDEPLTAWVVLGTALVLAGVTWLARQR
jgi:drug/metabolite transporter (DMT)-like permease